MSTSTTNQATKSGKADGEKGSSNTVQQERRGQSLNFSGGIYRLRNGLLTERIQTGTHFPGYPWRAGVEEGESHLDVHWNEKGLSVLGPPYDLMEAIRPGKSYK